MAGQFHFLKFLCQRNTIKEEGRNVSSAQKPVKNGNIYNPVFISFSQNEVPVSMEIMNALNMTEPTNVEMAATPDRRSNPAAGAQVTGKTGDDHHKQNWNGECDHATTPNNNNQPSGVGFCFL